MTNLKELAKYWVSTKTGDNIFPNSLGITCETAQELGKDILDLIKRIEAIENHPALLIPSLDYENNRVSKLPALDI